MNKFSVVHVLFGRITDTKTSSKRNNVKYQWLAWVTSQQAELHRCVQAVNKFDSNNDASNKLLNFLELFWILLNFLEFSWISTKNAILWLPCFIVLKSSFPRYLRNAWRTDRRTDRRTKPLIEFLFATKNQSRNYNINNALYTTASVAYTFFFINTPFFGAEAHCV